MSCNLAKLVPKGPLPELLAMSDEDKRKAKAREAARKHYLKRKAARAAGESAGILAVHKVCIYHTMLIQLEIVWIDLKNV